MQVIQKFSVVIPTYNRPQLLIRALASVSAQDNLCDDIIVIDDCSTIPASTVLERQEGLRVFRFEQNQGVNKARDFGLQKAKNNFVITLDDDDELLPDCLKIIVNTLNEFLDNNTSFPMFMFLVTNGTMLYEHKLLDARDFFRGDISGDTLRVIDRHIFQKENIKSPATKIGGEALLIWDLARRYGIPAWKKTVCKLNTDAPVRLTHTQNQINRAIEYAAYQEEIIQKFNDLFEAFPGEKIKRKLGAATYYLLAGYRKKSREYLRNIRPLMPHAVILYSLTFMPLWLVKNIYIKYRKATIN